MVTQQMDYQQLRVKLQNSQQSRADIAIAKQMQLRIMDQKIKE